MGHSDTIPQDVLELTFLSRLADSLVFLKSVLSFHTFLPFIGVWVHVRAHVCRRWGRDT